MIFWALSSWFLFNNIDDYDDYLSLKTMMMIFFIDDFAGEYFKTQSEMLKSNKNRYI